MASRTEHCSRADMPVKVRRRNRAVTSGLGRSAGGVTGRRYRVPSTGASVASTVRRRATDGSPRRRAPASGDRLLGGVDDHRVEAVLVGCARIDRSLGRFGVGSSSSDRRHRRVRREPRCTGHGRGTARRDRRELDRGRYVHRGHLRVRATRPARSEGVSIDDGVSSFWTRRSHSAKIRIG